jgi:hypothetical protein
VLAVATWTVIYHVFLILHVDAVWAAVAGAAVLGPCAWLAARRGGLEAESPRRRELAGSHRGARLLLGLNILAAGAAALLFAFTQAPWKAVWPLWVLAAGTAVVLTGLRVAGRVPNDPLAGSREAPRDGSSPEWSATPVALAWALGLGTLSLFLVRPDADDTQHVHLSTWVAAHGEFPLRDTLFSDQVFPAIIFPPLSSFEALLGTVARTAGLAAPDVVYFVVPPVASALSVLATWRLLRTWGVPMVGLALSVAMVFLLFHAQGNLTLGNLFIGRIWQGKIVVLTVLIPLVFALLNEYVARPTRRRRLLLAAAGSAGVGLTSTAAFVVPVVAGGCLAPLLRRSPRQAAVGFAATAAYPLGALVATAAVGSRRAALTIPSYSDVEAYAPRLAGFVLGDGLLALVALTALLVGPVLIRRAFAAQMTATTVLLVALLFAPFVASFVFDLTGLARVLWRWMWALPTAALVGVVATGLLGRLRPPALRALPAVALGAALLVWGTPMWSPAKMSVEAAPSWKRPAESVAAARRVLAIARPGDVVLAPASLSQTILIMSGRVKTVAPRGFYAAALRGVAGAHAEERLLLFSFAQHGLQASRWVPRADVRADAVARALRVVGVHIACVDERMGSARRLLRAEGYSTALSTETVRCFRSPGSA